ncbi:protein-glutamine gamma-glutamyltransferase [Paenibacillus durus]|uniref:protein-glutamine gamma-glutamyltransferase n=1 Tax=Paenibacillus durus TaxID=44251 RepID=UPI000AE26C7F|nr:protein-glutamine gamma-glutamyltransferase [Paenibacillus durus]
MITFLTGSQDGIDMSTLSGVEREIVEKKRRSPENYVYESPAALAFELNMRRRIVEAAVALDASGVTFVPFETTRGNRNFWSRTREGGLRLNDGVLPSDGINDIFRNGRLYAFECATAAVIVLYKGVLDALGEEVFNSYFKNLLLYDWQYDSDLQLTAVNNREEAYPGDVQYFKNPDHDPNKPEWQGENVIVLGRGMYFGHGIGITTAEGIISALNRERVPGSRTSAYLLDETFHPDFEYLRRLSAGRSLPSAAVRYTGYAVIARIGSHNYRIS